MDLNADMLDVTFDPPTPVLTHCNANVLNYIDSTFNSIIAALEAKPHEKVEVKLKRITSLDTSPQNDTQGFTTFVSRARVKSREMKYCWPGSTAEEAWRFSMSFFVRALQAKDD